MKKLVIESEKCSGCRYCELVCVFNKEKTIYPSVSRINIFYDWDNGLSTPVVCFHCEDAPCIKVCLSGALVRNEYGAVVVEKEKCIGCRLCVIACPFGNIQYSTEKCEILKCDLCNGDPVCVKFCPTGAIRFEEPEEKILKTKKEFADKVLSAIGDKNEKS